MVGESNQVPHGPGRLSAERRRDGHYHDLGRLLTSCPDQSGIVAAVSNFLFEKGANITESQQYSTDPFGGTFFLRVEFHLTGLGDRFGELERRFGALAERFSMCWN